MKLLQGLGTSTYRSQTVYMSVDIAIHMTGICIAFMYYGLSKLTGPCNCYCTPCALYLSIVGRHKVHVLVINSFNSDSGSLYYDFIGTIKEAY